MKKVSLKEWKQLLKQNPTNDDLRYLIEYTDKKDEASEQLLKQNPTNDDLRYLIEYTDKKDEAKKILDSREDKIIDIIKNR